MKIPIKTETTDLKLWYGDKQRYSSMTGVALITPELLVCSNYCMHSMYLVRFNLDENTYELIDSLPTSGSNNLTGPTDILCARTSPNGSVLLLTSDFQHCSVSFYDLNAEHTKLNYLFSVDNKHLGHCHGVSYYPGDEDIVVFTTTGTRNPQCGVYAFRLSGLIKTPPIASPFFQVREDGWLGKDCTFASPELLIALYCNSAPNHTEKRYYDCKVIVYRVNSNLTDNKADKLCEVITERHHGDSCVYADGKVFVTVEGVDRGGWVMVYNLDQISGALTLDHEVPGYSFPHGVDIRFGLMAVTEYGTSTVDIRKI